MRDSVTLTEGHFEVLGFFVVHLHAVLSLYIYMTSIRPGVNLSLAMLSCWLDDEQWSGRV